MTAQQKGVVGLGDGVGKAGVARGWWGNEVDETVPGQENGVNGSSVREDGRGKKLEPVYSMTTEGDGLWALTGTRVSPPSPKSHRALDRLSNLVRSNQPLLLATRSRSSDTYAAWPQQRRVMHVPPSRGEELPQRFLGWYS